MNTQRPFPLPADIGLRGPRPADHLTRAILAMARAVYDDSRVGAAEIVRRTWGTDVATLELVTRAAVSPATSTAAGWAAPLAAVAVADLISTLGPASAGSQLIKQALNLEFGAAAQIRIPTAIVDPADIVFVAEGEAIPVRDLALTGPTLAPKNLAVAFALTRQVVEGSNAERVLRAVLNESVGVSLDSVLFDDVAGSASRPVGLLFGITPLPFEPGGGDSAMMADLGALAAATAGIGGMNLAFVAAPDAAVKVGLRAGPNFRWPLYATNALDDGTIMAVALNALAVAADSEPRIQVTKESVAHMEADAPADISTPGTPNAISAPVRSFWQSDVVGVKLTLGISWTLRAPGAVAVINGVSW